MCEGDVGDTVDQVDRGRAHRSLPIADPAQHAVELDDWLLHVRYARTRDAATREQLVELYSAYARSLARRMHRAGEPLDDLVQVAMEGLLLAIERFDPDRGIPFPAFATPTIVGTLKRHYRDLGWGVRVPRRIHEVAAPVRQCADRLTVELGRSPMVSEVAAELGLTEDQVLEAQEASYARTTASLDASVGERGSQFDLLGEVDPEFGHTENRVALGAALAELSDRERELVQLYFVEELTQSEIGARLGISQMQVSRLLTQTVRRLRSRIVEPEAT